MGQGSGFKLDLSAHMKAANDRLGAPIVSAPTGQEHFAAPNSELKLSRIAESPELDETAQTIAQPQYEVNQFGSSQQEDSAFLDYDGDEAADEQAPNVIGNAHETA